MEEFCPLCLRNKMKNKIKLLQISLEEAMWSCESEKCVWPFGYEDLTYIQRKVGKSWSCYWDQQAQENYKAKDNLNSNCNPWRMDFRDLDEDKAKHTIERLHLSTNKSECAIANINSDIPMQMDSDKKINTGSKIQNDVSSPQDKLFKNEPDCHLVENKESNLCHNTNDSKGGPKVVHVEKINIDLSGLFNDAQISTNASSNKIKNGIEPNFKASASEESVKTTNAHPFTKSNVHVAAMQVNAIPTTLSYETLTTKETVHNASAGNKLNHKKLMVVKNILTPSTTSTSTPLKNKANVKHKLSSGKQYQKFDFNLLKSKTTLKTKNNDDNQPKTNNNKDDTSLNCDGEANKFSEFSNCQFNTKHNNITKSTELKISSQSNLKGLNKSNTTQNNAIKSTNGTLDDSTIPGNDSIDFVLDDFLNKDYSISEDISDEWINSLLN